MSPHSKANALVIGMGGVGSVIGQKLHDYPGFGRIFLADIDPAFARKLQEKTPDSRFEVAVLNAMETARVAAFLSEHQIAVTLNACTWHSNHSLLEACAQAGSHYIDLAADIYSPRGVRRPTKNSYEAEIERFDPRFREKNLTAVLCMGCDPGAVNVFARWAMDHLDHAESIRVAAPIFFCKSSGSQAEGGMNGFMLR